VHSCLQEARRAQGAGQAFAFPRGATAKAVVAALDVAEGAEPAEGGLAVARKSACWRVVELLQSAGLDWAGLGWLVYGWMDGWTCQSTGYGRSPLVQQAAGLVCIYALTRCR
jgi:hypothetical protein